VSSPSHVPSADVCACSKQNGCATKDCRHVLEEEELCFTQIANRFASKSKEPINNQERPTTAFYNHGQEKNIFPLGLEVSTSSVITCFVQEKSRPVSGLVTVDQTETFATFAKNRNNEIVRQSECIVTPSHYGLIMCPHFGCKCLATSRNRVVSTNRPETLGLCSQCDYLTLFDTCFSKTAKPTTPKKTKTKPRKARELTCRVCLKQYSSQGALTQHYRMHPGSKPYYCVLCSAGFSSQRALTNHNRKCRSENSVAKKNIATLGSLQSPRDTTASLDKVKWMSYRLWSPASTFF